MTGCNQSVFTELKKHQPDLILVPCVCHSLHLAAKDCVKKISTAIEFLLDEVYNWFSRSSKRWSSFNEVLFVLIFSLFYGMLVFIIIQIYATLFDGIPKKFVQRSGTRWLSYYESVIRVLATWDALKVYFGVAVQNERSYMARQLLDMLSDDQNHALLLFLKSLLKEFYTMNKAFQAESANQLKLMNDLIGMYEK